MMIKNQFVEYAPKVEHRAIEAYADTLVVQQGITAVVIAEKVQRRFGGLVVVTADPDTALFLATQKWALCFDCVLGGRLFYWFWRKR